LIIARSTHFPDAFIEKEWSNEACPACGLQTIGVDVPTGAEEGDVEGVSRLPKIIFVRQKRFDHNNLPTAILADSHPTIRFSVAMILCCHPTDNEKAKVSFNRGYFNRGNSSHGKVWPEGKSRSLS
jgi:hypothetical protein